MVLAGIAIVLTRIHPAPHASALQQLPTAHFSAPLPTNLAAMPPAVSALWLLNPPARGPQIPTILWQIILHQPANPTLNLLPTASMFVPPQTINRCHLFPILAPLDLAVTAAPTAAPPAAAVAAPTVGGKAPPPAGA